MRETEVKRPKEPPKTFDVYPGFCSESPSAETAVGIFDNWVCKIPGVAIKTGEFSVFSADDDPRPSYAQEVFGNLAGFDVLELGPLEGGHTYQLEKMGADVTAIEGFNQSFLKLLIIKEILELRARVLYGDFVKYLEATNHRYDMIFACGVLYHMVDPLRLLHLISERTDRVFLWTHYVPPPGNQGSHNYVDVSSVTRFDFETEYYRNSYDADHPYRLFAGTAEYSNHMTRDAILAALEHFGYRNVRVMADHSFTISLTAHR